MRNVLLVLGLLCVLPAAYAERVRICHAYDCSEQSVVNFPPQKLAEIQRLFKNVRSAEAEREAVGRAVGMMYLYAGTQSPIWQDRPGNDDEEDLPGRMDCIDHSTNTTTFLLLMAERGWLRFHDVGPPVRRNFWNAHWAADLKERATGARYAVDSWFFDPGEPAAVFVLDSWLRGARPQPALN